MHNKILPFLNIYPFFNSPRVSCFSCDLLFFSIRSPKLGTRNHRRPVCSRSSRNEIVRSHIFVPRNLISRNSRQRKCHAPWSERDGGENIRYTRYRLYYAAELSATRAYICFDELQISRLNIAKYYVDSIQWYSLYFFPSRKNFSRRIFTFEEENGWMTMLNTIFASIRPGVASLSLTPSYVFSTSFPPQRLRLAANDDYLASGNLRNDNLGRS